MLIAFVGVVAAFSLFVSTSALRAHACGWNRLAKTYRFDGSLPKPACRTTLSAALGQYQYATPLRFGVDGDALYIESPSMPFHPPLRIPWRQIRTTLGRHLFQRSVDLVFDADPRYRAKLTLKLATQLAEASNGALVVPEQPPSRFST